MEQRILTLLFLCFCILGNSQNNESIYPNFIGQNLNTIENNSDWRILQKSSGDLNKDDLTDFALILESKDSILEKRRSDCKLLKNKPRIIIVMLNKNGYEETIIQNNKFIALGDEGGMLPYLEPELSIENGLLIIYYQFARSNQSYTFEFNNNQMVIIKAESNGVESATGNFENDKYDFKKGEIISETGNILEEKVSTEIIKFSIKPKTLSEFGEMSEWEIAENKYL
ncbi:hypothetical protein EV196_104177 [Mariniflexile fucanivorans]|uniref:Uncharacterized protein n=2 Tax=Mariniflexile fucanivorans TaxID=264023 RepID=A0A4V2QDZ5_9FLAO|nr:hypothetical protein EV196_104177 [Mariniflexile fucanivorans]